MKKTFLFFILLIFFALNAKGQCLGDNIVNYVNTDSVIQKAIRKSFDLKKGHHPIVVNADTSLTYLDYNYCHFKDTLAKIGYSKKRLDSLSRSFGNLPDSLKKNAPAFCGKQFISDETNYKEKKDNFVLMLSQQNDSFVIGEIICCTDSYYKTSTLKKNNSVLIMFFYGKEGEIERTIVIPLRSLCNPPVYK
jgi:hypothetical protein